MRSNANLESIPQPGTFRTGIVIPLWSVMVWLVLMNTTMFNIALPSIIGDLKITAATGSWIVTGYSIVLAISTITYSRLSDFIPIRRLLMIGVLLFGFSSIIGYFSHQYGLLLFARLMQAAGAGASQALGMVLAARYIPLATRGKAMSMIGAGASLAFGLGPIVGGILAQVLSWHYLFVVTGLVFFLVPFLYKYIPAEQPSEGKFDLLGAILIAVGTTGLLLFLSTFSYVYFVISAIAYIWCWKHLHKVSIPFIQPQLLHNRNYLKIVFMGFAAFAAHFSTLFCLPILLAEMFHMQSGEIGLIIFPGAMISACAAIIVGRIIDRYGTHLIMTTGHGLLVLSTILFYGLSSLSPYFSMIGYLFMSLGFFSLIASLANELTRILPNQQVGSGMGMQQLMQFFGGAFGVTVAGLLITLQKNMEPAVSYPNIFLAICTLVVISSAVLFLYLSWKKKQSGLSKIE
jgi:DHA2 family metal-tetracycline-proton antiporter-like MFS transporter